MKKVFLTLALGACTSFGLATASVPCYAQPADGGGMAQNPNPQDEALKQAMAEGMKQAKAMMAMTPAQRREWMNKTMEQQLRTLMALSGFGDLGLQDRIILFTQEQSAAKLGLRQSTARLRDAMANKAATPEQVTAALSETMAATKVERERTAKAEGALAEELELDKSPRLEGFLRLYGIIGDAPALLGGVMGGVTVLSTLPDPGELPAR